MIERCNGQIFAFTSLSVWLTPFHTKIYSYAPLSGNTIEQEDRFMAACVNIHLECQLFARKEKESKSHGSFFCSVSRVIALFAQKFQPYELLACLLHFRFHAEDDEKSDVK